MEFARCCEVSAVDLELALDDAEGRPPGEGVTIGDASDFVLVVDVVVVIVVVVVFMDGFVLVVDFVFNFDGRVVEVGEEGDTVC